MNFKSIEPFKLQDNPFKLMQRDWMLMTVKDGDKINTMTVGWGGFGALWGMNVVYVAVRPERYTFEFAQKSDTFSLTAFPGTKEMRKMLAICGTKSGRDMDKIKECGLTVCYDDETPYFEEARLVMTCRKIAIPQFSEEDFTVEPEFVSKWYGGENRPDGRGGGFHYLYIAEVTNILVKEDK